MRIIYYSAHPHLDLAAQTGYGRHMRETIAAMRKAGHDVHPLVMGRKTETTSGKGHEPGWKSLVKRIVPRYVWRSAKEYKLMQYDQRCAENLKEAVNRFKPDLIYERLAWMQDSGGNVAAMTGTRTIVEINAPFEEEVSAFENAGSLFESKGIRKLKKIFERADKIVTVSVALAEHLKRKYGADANKIVVVPNAVNPEDFTPNMDKAEAVRTQNKLEGNKVIGFVGSIFPYHGVDILIRAFASMNVNLRRGMKLLIVGDGYQLPELSRLTTELGCEDNVIFTGSVPSAEVSTYISLMDICVMAKSNWYGSPVKIFEYGVMGKPVIAPDVQPVREVMNDGIDGLIRKDSVSEIARAISYLCENEKEAEQMGKHFRNKILERFTWDRVLSKIIN